MQSRPPRGRCAPNSSASQVLRCCSGRSQARGVSGAFCGLPARDIAGTVPANQPKETTHGYHPRYLHQARQRRFTGTFKTLTSPRRSTIVPVDKMSDNAPDHRVYAGTALRGRRRLEPGREIERRDLREPQDRRARIRAELGPLPPRQARTPAEDGSTHIALWEPRDRADDDAPSRVTAAGLPSVLSREACPSLLRRQSVVHEIAGHRPP